MKPNWYIKNKILYIKKRKNYYEIRTEFNNGALLLDIDDINIIKNGQLGFTGNYFKLNNELLHRLIKKGKIIYHINRNKLDNRKENLEICENKLEHFKKHFNCKKNKSTNLNELIEILSELDEYEISPIKTIKEINILKRS